MVGFATESIYPATQRVGRLWRSCLVWVDCRESAGPPEFTVSVHVIFKHRWLRLTACVCVRVCGGEGFSGSECDCQEVLWGHCIIWGHGGDTENVMWDQRFLWSSMWPLAFCSTCRRWAFFCSFVIPSLYESLQCCNRGCCKLTGKKDPMQTHLWGREK